MPSIKPKGLKVRGVKMPKVPKVAMPKVPKVAGVKSPYAKMKIK